MDTDCPICYANAWQEVLDTKVHNAVVRAINHAHNIGVGLGHHSEEDTLSRKEACDAVESGEHPLIIRVSKDEVKAWIENYPICDPIHDDCNDYPLFAGLKPSDFMRYDYDAREQLRAIEMVEADKRAICERLDASPPCPMREDGFIAF